MVADNVSSQGNNGQLRGGLRNNVNSVQDSSPDSGTTSSSSLSLGDLTSLLRGGADILESNSPRLVALANRANQLGGPRK